ncbi:MAG: hypothetical protein QM687_06515 [Ferruginibacter sp.]
MKYCKLLLLVVVTVIGLQVSAQTKPIAKFKPPKLYTQLGSYRDTVKITVAEAEQLIAQPLKIFDDKKTVYQVSSYMFVYREIGVTEDEQTGKVTPTSTIKANLFKQSPLPQNWSAQIQEMVKPGDEIEFIDVIAKDAKGIVMFSGNLKLIITK